MLNSILAAPRLGAFIISSIVVLMFGFVIGWILTHVMASNPMLDGLVGALTSQFVLVVGFWIGSSASSAKKDDVIATQAATASAVQGAAVPPKTGP